MSNSPLEKLLSELFRKPDLAAAREFLAANPSLIAELPMRLIYLSASKFSDRATQERLRLFSDLIQKAMEKGLDAAFEELRAAPPRRPQGFEWMQLGSRFLDAEDDAEAVNILQQYPEFPVAPTLAMAQVLVSRAEPRVKEKLEKRVELLRQWQLGSAMRKAQAAEARYRQQPTDENFATVAQANEAVCAASSFATLESGLRAEVLARNAGLQYQLWGSTFDPEVLDRVITRSTQAAELVPGSCIDILGVALISRYESRGTAADLDSAVTLLGRAAPGDQIPPNDPRPAVLATNLANALRHRSLVTGSAQDAERAVNLYEQLVQIPVPDAEPERKRVRLLNLTSGLMTRYDASGDLADLNRAIPLMQELREAGGELGISTLANNLGLALMKRFAVTKQQRDLADAQGALIAAVKAAPRDSPELPRNLTNLAECLREIFRQTKKREMLDAAIDAHFEALRRIPAGQSEAGFKMTMACATLLERFGVSRQKKDLDAALQLARDAAASYPQDSASPQYFGALGAVAEALRTRAESEFAMPEDVAEAIRLYRQSVNGLLQESPLYALDAALQWGRWAGDRKQWAEGAEALLAAMEAQQRILDAQQDRLTRELRLKRTQGLGALAATYLVRDGQAGRAVVALERGRGLLAAQHLKLRPEQVTFLGISEKITDHPLVYIENVDGGLGLVMNEGRVRVLSFSELREETLNTWLALKIDLRERDATGWEQALTEICEVLWNELMGPLIEALKPWDRVTLVAGGYLAMLPLHAAWKTDPSRPTGRFYAADALTIRYAPGVGALRPGAELRLSSILGVDEPAPVKAPRLPFSKAEVAEACSLFPARTIFRKTKARRSAVLEAMPEHSVMAPVLPRTGGFAGAA